MVVWPTRQQVLAHMPPHFLNHQNVHSVFDCTEFSTEKPSGLAAQAETWSEYKHDDTAKLDVGVTPIGLVDFLSRVWGGRASDRYIMEKEGVLNKIPVGMAAMADKGFEVEDLLPHGVNLIMPPKVSTKTQMSDSDFFKTVDVAEPCVVVEMKMEQGKNYRILQTPIPISRIATAEQVIHNCFALTNLLPPLFTPATSDAAPLELPIYE